MSTNERLPKWTMKSSPYYALWISERSKRRNSDKKKSDGLFRSCSSSSDCQKCSGRFPPGNFNLTDQPRNGRPPGVDEDFLLVIVDNKLKISTEKFTKSLKIDLSTNFRHLKKFKNNGRFWQIVTVLFFHYDNARQRVSKQTLQNPPAPTEISSFGSFEFSFVPVSTEPFISAVPNLFAPRTGVMQIIFSTGQCRGRSRV